MFRSGKGSFRTPAFGRQIDGERQSGKQFPLCLFCYKISLKRRVPKIDFQNAKDAGFEGLEDPVVLALAANEGRILVTHDRRTMPLHFAEFIAMYNCPGVTILSKRAQISSVIEELTLYLGSRQLRGI